MITTSTPDTSGHGQRAGSATRRRARASSRSYPCRRGRGRRRARHRPATCHPRPRCRGGARGGCPRAGARTESAASGRRVPDVDSAAPMALFRRAPRTQPAPRRALPPPGVIRRERRIVQRQREDKLRDLGGLMLEMYRRDTFREDLLADRCNELLGLDARLRELDEMLAAARRRIPAGRCECGAPLPWGSHFCPNCGRPAGERAVVACAECGHPLPGRRALLRQLRRDRGGRRGSSPARSRSPRPMPAPPEACLTCGTAVEPGQEYCLECGARVVPARRFSARRARVGAARGAATPETGCGRPSCSGSSPPARRPQASSPAATPARRAARGR